MRFSIATRDELWMSGRLVESRLSHGEALQRGQEIIAADTADEELVRASDRLIAGLPIPDADRVRVVVSARRIAEHRVDSTTMIVTRDGLTIVWPGAQLPYPYPFPYPFPAFRANFKNRERVRERVRERERERVRQRSPNIVWRNGSAAVLLHEAIGHAAEHEHAPIHWPSWLTVHDEPTTVDDCGSAPRFSDLLHEPPSSLRRESFRDIPLRRMSNLIARGTCDFELPAQRVEVHFVEGGHYEPLTETVSLRIAAADFIDEDKVAPMAPFDLVATRQEIARALKGAAGAPLEYPGVICSSEGQEVFVGSFAPAMLAVFE